MGMSENKYTIKSTEKIFSILEELAKHGGSLKLTEISHILNFPTSTAHRHLMSLLELGYVNQNMETGSYSLSVKILPIAKVVLENLDLRKIAYSHLENLRNRTGETANLVIENSNEALYIEKVESNATVRVFSLIGRRAPLHASGVGKVLLADLGWSEVVDILKHTGMERFTANTITDFETLMKELESIRQNGYAIDNEECEEGAMCIATPIKDYSAKTIASISVSAPKARFTRNLVPRLIAIIKEEATGLSSKLGYVDITKQF